MRESNEYPRWMAKIYGPTINPVEVATTKVGHDWIDKMLKFKIDDMLPRDKSRSSTSKKDRSMVLRVVAFISLTSEGAATHGQGSARGQPIEGRRLPLAREVPPVVRATVSGTQCYRLRRAVAVAA
ncbi:hypothetical protein BHM03_00043055 [Ensete ventricosum]|nr:hypothetical protein BHM03_00043055 [Ensete ventricosum]